MKDLLRRHSRVPLHYDHNGWDCPVDNLSSKRDESGNPCCNLDFKSKFKAWMPAFAGMTMFGSVALTSCLPKSIPTKPGDPDWGLEITWHGHSCFSLKDSAGRVVVFDPFDETVGYEPVHLFADVLIISHNHFDHNNKYAVKALHTKLDVVESTGTTLTACGLYVTGIRSYHDKAKGAIDGPNTIFTLFMGGLKVVFMGDYGEGPLSDYRRNMVGPADILFIPVGGQTTIDAAEAKNIVDDLKPGFVFPMHYGNLRFFKFDEVQMFTSLFPPDQLKVLSQSDIRVKKAEATDKSQIFTLIPSAENK